METNWSQVSNQVRTRIWRLLLYPVSNQVYEQVSRQVSEQVWKQVWNQSWDRLIRQIGERNENK